MDSPTDFTICRMTSKGDIFFKKPALNDLLENRTSNMTHTLIMVKQLGVENGNVYCLK